MNTPSSQGDNGVTESGQEPGSTGMRPERPDGRPARQAHSNSRSQA
ncbi:hypothetical protein HMPREF9136_1788 [Prevotella dentalis DSM 3688]|uniref:Uncharacterized protein n=1 Tax=Prevotella dentalis (strain ATCC 49559 / DSM 3688 / JCM 13448 / NCTC 12043 / ES 2772) TaxID=908937 RepID=F9D4L0_PREDD|nr:hypothetical protein HMPREF9136_1788 [Prevotella dentalis DSM 3688]